MQRGSDKNSPKLDEEMKQEVDAMLKGSPQAPHTEEFRQTEGLPDDTDSEEVQASVDAEDSAATRDEQ
jgi:hypothetical protein